jgi:ribosomal protein S18 acetylase RimI-like enzyme
MGRRKVGIRRAHRGEGDAVAALFRLTRLTLLPFLPDLHTPSEDCAFLRDRVFAMCEVWVAERTGRLVGFCAFREGWVDHLYVHPAHQRQGIGAALLRKATDANETVQLWTFQRNTNAIRFYESQGFTSLKLTDGSDNEEREPDALYGWTQPSSSRTG